MRRFNLRAVVTAVLAVAAVASACGEALAGSVGITIPTVKTQPVGDPQYEYAISVDLLAGSTLENGGYFTIYDFPEIASRPLTLAPNTRWGASAQYQGITPSGVSPTDSPSLWNVTFVWNGSAVTAPANQELSLGTFYVGTTITLNSPPTGTLTYVGSLDGIHASNLGTVTINAVPEPSSVISLAAGVAFALAGYARARQRRAAAPSA